MTAMPSGSWGTTDGLTSGVKDGDGDVEVSAGAEVGSLDAPSQPESAPAASVATVRSIPLENRLTHGNRLTPLTAIRG
jgi:hypothetical protein